VKWWPLRRRPKQTPVAVATPAAKRHTRQELFEIATLLWTRSELMLFKLEVIDSLRALGEEDKEFLRRQAERAMRREANEFLDLP
jgi:hypothetical protein